MHGFVVVAEIAGDRGWETWKQEVGGQCASSRSMKVCRIVFGDLQIRGFPGRRVDHLDDGRR